MKFGVVVFPGTWSDCDFHYVISEVLHQPVKYVWHRERELGDLDCVVLPGGFSYGDYLRCGAMAACSPIMDAVREHARAGGLVFGVCNGFQILCEAGLLPGALVRNRSLSFICDMVTVRVESIETPFTHGCRVGELLHLPIKHGEGCWVADENTVAALEQEERVVFRYVDQAGRASAEANPNGSLRNVAGVCSATRNVLGLMPHPEHAVERAIGIGSDHGLALFRSVQTWVAGQRPGAAREPGVVSGP